MGCFYRFNRLFNVSKTRAAVVAILTAIAGIAMLPLGADFGSVAGMFFVWSAIYGGIWLYKFKRDQKLHVQIRAIQQPPAEAPIAMNQPESSRLYVPRKQDM
jgi:hypothetical protein